MSCVEVNDENRGVSSLGGKHSDLNEDIFAVGNPTGRPSILRQTENLPSNTVAKGTKVCFQTPRRDPLTKRILSPSKTSKMTNVDECVKAMESLHLEKTSRGEYQMNFENLDALNPFQSSNKMALSPMPPATETPPQISDKTSPSLAKIDPSLTSRHPAD
uniref:Uncharacterized protein n=1 Tax=Neogobius melanostomus TaxID=47308 RepID=A0A8C6WKT5_9GOBI